MKRPFFTIGHSNHTLDEFMQMLAEPSIEFVVDIRRIPMSRNNPQFNIETFPETLLARGISYEHISGLGGLRGRDHDLPSGINSFWENKSFHNYADYALSQCFHVGFEHLLDLGRQKRSAIMCSEALWWRCHRRIVADYLIAAGETVFHVMERGRLEPALLTPGAIVDCGRVVYPAD